MKAVSIEWDCDGEAVELPTEVELPEDYTEEDYCEIADYLSDQYGWCVESFDIES